MALLRNMVMAVSEALERQRPSWMSWASASRQPTSCRQRLAIHATKCPIVIANSDSAAAAYTDAAIDQAHSAVQELLAG
jgi:carboxylesterase type B